MSFSQIKTHKAILYKKYKYKYKNHLVLLEPKP